MRYLEVGLLGRGSFSGDPGSVEPETEGGGKVEVETREVERDMKETW